MEDVLEIILETILGVKKYITVMPFVFFLIILLYIQHTKF